VLKRNGNYTHVYNSQKYYHGKHFRLALDAENPAVVLRFAGHGQRRGISPERRVSPI